VFSESLPSRKWQLLGGKRRVNKALRQTLELEVIKQAVRYSIRLWKTSDRALEEPAQSQSKEDY
jgi:hypothetical protein